MPPEKNSVQNSSSPLDPKDIKQVYDTWNTITGLASDMSQIDARREEVSQAKQNLDSLTRNAGPTGVPGSDKLAGLPFAPKPPAHTPNLIPGAPYDMPEMPVPKPPDVQQVKQFKGPTAADYYRHADQLESQALRLKAMGLDDTAVRERADHYRTLGGATKAAPTVAMLAAGGYIAAPLAATGALGEAVTATMAVDSLVSSTSRMVSSAPGALEGRPAAVEQFLSGGSDFAFGASMVHALAPHQQNMLRDLMSPDPTVNGSSRTSGNKGFVDQGADFAPQPTESQAAANRIGSLSGKEIRDAYASGFSAVELSTGDAAKLESIRGALSKGQNAAQWRAAQNGLDPSHVTAQEPVEDTPSRWDAFKKELINMMTARTRNVSEGGFVGGKGPLDGGEANTSSDKIVNKNVPEEGLTPTEQARDTADKVKQAIEVQAKPVQDFEALAKQAGVELEFPPKTDEFGTLVHLRAPGMVGYSAGVFVKPGKTITAKDMKDAVVNRYNEFIEKPIGPITGAEKLYQTPEQLTAARDAVSNFRPQSEPAAPKEQVVPARQDLNLARTVFQYDPVKNELAYNAQNSFDKLVSTLGEHAVAKAAGNNEQMAVLQKKLEVLNNNAKFDLTKVANKIPMADLPNRVAILNTLAENFNVRAKAAKDLTAEHVMNISQRKELTELRRQGGPPKLMAMEEGPAQVVKESDQFGRWGRMAVSHYALGQVLRHGIDDIIPHTKEGMIKNKLLSPSASDSEFQDAQNWARNMREQELTNFKAALESYKGNANPDSLSRLLDSARQFNYYSNLLGSAPISDLSQKDAKVGDLEDLPLETGPRGEIKFDPTRLEVWNRKRANQFFGRSLAKNPSVKEIFEEISRQEMKAKALKIVADFFTKVYNRRLAELKSQRGALGSLKNLPIPGKTVPSKLEQRLQPRALMAEAQRRGIEAWEVSDTKIAGYDGFLSKDGKVWIDNGPLPHHQVAAQILPDIELKGSAMKVMLDAGWVRADLSAGENNYELNDALTETRANALEMDMIRRGTHGQNVNLDIHYGGQIVPITIQPGWENLHKAIKEEIRTAAAYEQNSPEWLKAAQGAIGVGLAVGALALALHSHIGGPITGPFGHDGMYLGFMWPGFATTKAFRNTARLLTRLGQAAGMTARNILMGKPQNPSINSRLSQIRQEQYKDLHNVPYSFVERFKRLPTKFIEYFYDQTAKLNPEVNPLLRFAMSFDEEGKVFRDLHGQIKIEDSPYHLMVDTMGIIHGQHELNTRDYLSIKKDAEEAGLTENFADLLNLNGYKRVYEVMNERMQDYQQEWNTHQTALVQNPNMNPRERIQHEDMRDAAQSKINKLRKKMQAGDLAPAGYTHQQVSADLRLLEQTVGPLAWAKLQQLAGRVYDINRKVLDLAHSMKIVSTPNYQKFVSRGPEYIPMDRILSDLAFYTDQRRDGVSKQLYLMQSNAIDALQGSTRTNRDPIQASADANREIIAEAHRNHVILKYLQLAGQHPQINALFTPVSMGHLAKAGYMVIGGYINGKPAHYEVPNWLGGALHISPSASDVGFNALLRAEQHLLRKVATHGSVAFALTNLPRHAADMLLMSKAGLSLNPIDNVNLLKTYLTSLHAAIKHNDIWRAVCREGAVFSTSTRMMSPERFTTLNELGWKEKLAKGHIIDFVQDFNTMNEDAFHTTIFRRMREKGYSIEAARHEAKTYGGAPDYSIHGKAASWVGAMAMFFNAGLRYIERAFTLVQKNPTRALAVLAALTSIQLALYEHNSRITDSNGVQMLRKISPIERENNYIYLTGETYISHTGAEMPIPVKFPKGSMSRFFANPIEKLISKMAGDETESGKQIAINTFLGMAPGRIRYQEGQSGSTTALSVAQSLNPALKIPAEELANQTQFGPIVPPRQSQIEPQFQTSPMTSPTIAQMGEGGVHGAEAGAGLGALTGEYVGGHSGALVGSGIGASVGFLGDRIGPRRIEHMYRGFGGAAADVSMGISDPFFGGKNKPVLPLEGPEALRQKPVVGTVIGRYLGSGADQEMMDLNQKFYNLSAKFALADKTYASLAKAGRTSDAAVYLKTHQKDISLAKSAAQVTQLLAKLRQAQQSFMYNKELDMTPEQRKAALINIYQAQLRVLKNAISALEGAQETGTTQTMPGTNTGNATNR